MPQRSTFSKSSLAGVVQPVRIGFIPLVDCAPLLVARHMDLFSKHGVRVELNCEVGWATIREKLLYGQLDAVHAIAGLVLALRLGLSTPPCRVVAPFVFNLHGNAITLSRDLWNRGVRDSASLKKLIRSAFSRRFTFGMVSRYSSHYFLLRQWLQSGGIDVEKDVRIVALPPTQMASSLAEGLIDGYCVGEPWNSYAVERGIGWIAATSEQLAPGHPEKVLLTTERFVTTHAEESQAIINALKEACEFCDVRENRPEVVRVLADSGYFTGYEKILQRSLVGPLDLGSDKSVAVADFHIFHRREANTPTNDRGRWLLEQFIAHGLLASDQYTDAASALREAWTAELHFPKAKAAASNAPKPAKSNKRSSKTKV
ncbi:MAG: ABC transporter substrate-binding protein [Prosthecobacter sp.]|uniref:CmpA/NrtA family ABC transporter substrate-binding protein n=1 Tax=Prosthecobacter sp. TaxID=1965333 RepID=UPI0025E81DA1|nr:CmpA/NrtA family ABC transporter substrate-binding protein [Prosthecobacter sp.]MCF7786602.1 ABC transporter substrate-binding protein [Prosthecobacter sp.]